MQGLLSQHELRHAAKGPLAVAAVGLLAVAGWLSPWSPGAMDHAADLAAHGDTQAAIDVYLDLADGHCPTATQVKARWSAAWLASVDAAHPQQAVDLLRDFVQRYPHDQLTARAWDRLAVLYRLYQSDPVRAAQAWEAAAAVSTDPDQAAQRLLDAGLAYAKAGLLDRASDTLSHAAASPTADQSSVAVQAHLALGRLALKDDPALAYDHYSTALGQTASSADASLARLGMASALESLNQVDQALAELEQGPADDEALTRRLNRLQARDSQ